MTAMQNNSPAQEDYAKFMEELFSPEQTTDKPEALEGIRVLDLSHMIFGPTAARILGAFGADVIKIEVPYVGDYWRGSTYWGKYWKHSNPLWHFINHSKYFVAIDVKKPEGKELILQLAEKADVVIENFSPGTVEAWGIGYSTISKINPKVIYTSCSTYGQFGPYRFRPGWDLLAQGTSGMLAATGYPNTDHFFKVPDFYGDFYPGNFAAMMILLALNARERTGKGQFVDLAQGEILMRALPHFTHDSISEEQLQRTGNQDPAAAPSGIFKTKDEHFVALAVGAQDQFQALCQAMGRTKLADDPRYKDTLNRLKPGPAGELTELVGDWAAEVDLEKIIALAVEHGFPASPVLNDMQICHDQWRRHRGNIIEFEDVMYGKMAIQTPTTKLSGTPSRIKWLTRPLGYHNRYVFKKYLGLSESRISELEKSRAVGYWDYRVGQRPPVYYDINNDPIFNYSPEA